MKTLMKKISLILAMSLIFGMCNFEAFATENEAYVSSDDGTEENQRFDENAHGEIIQVGGCGDDWYKDNPSLKYKLYEDGTLYVYGEGEIKRRVSSDITELYIENGIISIGNSSFQNCKNLKKIRFPEGLENIGYQAFAGCVELDNIFIPESVLSIGESAFMKCGSLTSIKIPNGIKRIENQTFTGCEKLKNVEMPETTEEIGIHAFSYCSSLVTIKIPKGVTLIEERAFMNCENLLNIEIPEGIKDINNYLFWNCKNLEFVHIPDSVETIGNESFWGCEKLSDIKLSIKTKSIGDSAFALCDSLEELEIPDSVTIIGKSAFSSCFKLKVYCKTKSIAEWYAIGNFINYELLEGESENPVFPNSFDENEHGDIVYEGDCEENNKYNPKVHCKLYEDGMVYIYGNGVVGEIDYEYMGFQCAYLYIEDGITGIGENVFYNSRIGWIRFPDTITSIWENSFRGCKVKKLVFPNGLKSIGEFAFSGCGNLEKIYIPESVENIKGSSFSYCENIKNIEVSEENEVYDSRDNCNAIIETERNNLVRGCMNTIIPEGIEYVGEYSFSDCVGLKNIEIPEGVKEIGQRAFIGCEDLERIKLPSSIKSIGEYAFYGCNKVQIHRHIYQEIIEKEPTYKENGIVKYVCDCGYEYAKETPKIEIEIKNIFNGCKGSPVKLSISCKESDEFTFECIDGCGMESKYTGYSSMQIGATSFYSKGYSLTFDISGEHIISVYKNGKIIENDKIIIAENHTWDSGKIESNPTCTKDGKKKYTCSNCENSYTEEIISTGHEYIENITKKAACTSDGIKKYTCSKCGDSYTKTIPRTGHKYGEWKVYKKPTIFKSGTNTRKCSNCRKTENKTIKKLKSSVSIKKKVSIKAGKKITIKIIKKSKGDTVSNWKSSKKSVAIVNKKGKVTAKKKGTAKITVKMKSGCKATCNVTVK